MRGGLIALVAFIVLSYGALCGSTPPGALATHYIGGGEVVSWSNWMWWFDYALFTLHSNPLYLHYLFFPLQVPVPDGVLVLLVLAPLTHLAGSVVAYNVYVITAFSLAGFAMYLFAFRLFDDRLAAFFAGVIFTFSTQHFAQGTSHLHVYSTYWIPLVALAWARFLAAPKPAAGTLLGLAIAATALTSWTLAVMALAYCGIYALFEVRRIAWRRALPALLLGAFAAIAMVSPALVAFLRLRSFPGSVMRLSDSIFWSADVLGFFTPPEQNLLWGSMAAPLFRHFTGNAWEAAVYLGTIPLLFCCGAIFFRPWSRIVRFHTIAAIVFAVLSLGPALHFAGIWHFSDAKLTVALPGALLQFVPPLDMMRTPNRYGILVMFCVAIVATHALATGSARYRGTHPRFAATACLAITAFAFCDSLYAFPLQPANPVPRIYKSIGTEKGAEALLEIPMIRSPLATGPMHNGAYLYYYEYQKQHRHPLVGGYFNRANPAHARVMEADPLLDVFYAGRSDITTPGVEDTLEYLYAKHGIGYVVLHKNFLPHNTLEFFTNVLGTGFIDDDSVPSDRVRVYKHSRQSTVTTTSPALAVQLVSGWYACESWNNAPTRWIASRASLDISAERAVLASISFHVRSIQGSRTLLLRTDRSSHSFPITDTWSAVTVSIPLAPGMTRVELSVPEGAVKPSDISSQSNDRRELAAAFQDLRASFAHGDAAALPPD